MRSLLAVLALLSGCAIHGSGPNGEITEDDQRKLDYAHRQVERMQQEQRMRDTYRQCSNNGGC